MNVKIEKENWSKESKQSYSYLDSIELYENIPYLCYKCGESSVFTAEEQKEAFEVKKAYIWKRRILCRKCYVDFKAIKERVYEYETFWKNETDESKKNALYLLEWLSAINEFPKYGKPKNAAMAKRLFKIINKIT